MACQAPLWSELLETRQYPKGVSDGCFLILAIRKSLTEARERKPAQFTGLVVRNLICMYVYENNWLKVYC